jgi:hypothetical protein
MGFQKVFGKTLGLFSEEEVTSVGVACFRIGPGGFGRQAPHLADIVFGEEIIQIIVVAHIYHVPVIQTSPSNGFFRDVETERTDQVQGAAGGCAGPGNVAAVLRNLGLYQNDIYQKTTSFMRFSSQKPRLITITL